MSRAIFNIYDAKQSGRGEYFKKGSGEAVIVECLKKDDADAGEVFVMRAKITKASPKDGQPCNSVGERVGWPQLLTKYPKMAPGNIQNMILAAVGVSKEQITKDQFVETYEDMINYVPGTKSEHSGRLINEVQGARGMLIRFDTYDQLSKEQKAILKSNPNAAVKPNTYVKFYHVPGQTEEEIAARRAELDKTDPCEG